MKISRIGFKVFPKNWKNKKKFNWCQSHPISVVDSSFLLISRGEHQFFLMLLFARSHFDWLITKKFWNIGHHPIESTELLPFSIWGYILGNTLKTCQGEYFRNLMGTPLGNSMGTHWEQEIFYKRKKKHPSLPTQKERKKKNWALLSACQALSLATWKLWFYSCMSPFLTLANGRSKGEYGWVVEVVVYFWPGLIALLPKNTL